MIFTSVTFVVFFLVVFCAYWGVGLLPVKRPFKVQARKWFILLASYFFYGSWDWRFLFLIWFTTLADWFLGWAIDRAAAPRRRLHYVIFSVVLNLTFLGIFKYFNFFIFTFQQLADSIGVHTHPVLLNIILPIGISFYTFQSLSYTLDIYRGRLAPEPSLLNFAFFISFFPHIVAGPIVRAADFLPQVREDHLIREIDFDAAFDLILRGFAKKILISDVVSSFADQVFAHPGNFGTLNTWLGVLSYAMQIYCDFSGYTDIAIGLAALLGYKLMRNFDLPYMASGFADFWHRWHISLSVWLRDYLYISLGGNRYGKWKTYRNLMLTMLLGGLWHGAAYTFIIWGGLHGLYLVGERVLTPFLAPRVKFIPGSIRRILLISFTFVLVNIAWVFFRAQNLSDAGTILQRLFIWHTDKVVQLPPYSGFLLAIAYLVHAGGEFRKAIPDRWFTWIDEVYIPLRMAALLILLVVISASNEQPFIYFQF